MSGRLAALAAGALLGLAALAAARPAGAQIGQFRLSGSVDQDLAVDNLKVGDETFRTFSWGSRYAPALDGFILDPRLLGFSFSGTFADQQTDATTGDTRALTIEPYRLSVALLPFGLNTLTLRASRTESDFEFELGEISRRTDARGANWTFRGQGALPETSLDLNQETVEERLFTGFTERTRSTLALIARKTYERFQPRLAYTAELTETKGTIINQLEEDGLKHRVQYDDRIKVGAQGFLTPLLDYTRAPDHQEAIGNLTFTGPLSPSIDGSAGLRYSLFERDHAIQTTALQGQLVDRLTPDLVLTGVGNATYVTGAGPDAWGGGGIVALRAVPFSHLTTVTDYGLQLSGGGTGGMVSHRGHLNAVSTIVPRHTLTGDYFFARADASPAGGSFTSHNGLLEVTSLLIPLTTTTASYTLELQEGAGDRAHHAWRLGAEARPRPPVTARAGATYFTEDAAGGGRVPRQERGWLADAGVALGIAGWIDLSLAGRYGRKEVSREDREGTVELAGISAAATVTLGSLFFRGEGFLERDQDARQNRRGARGNLSYRFRVWTITAEFEVSNLRVEGLDVARDRVSLRITRPLDFIWP